MTVQEILDLKLDGVIRPHKGSVKIDETGTGKDDPAYTLNMKVDFTGWTVQQVLDNLAIPNAWISRQRALRTLKKSEIEALQKNTSLIHVNDMGKKPKFAVDIQASYVASFENASAEEQQKMLEELIKRMKAPEAPAPEAPAQAENQG